jgi:iron complex outermembrane recepter protein
VHYPWSHHAANAIYRHTPFHTRRNFNTDRKQRMIDFATMADRGRARAHPGVLVLAAAISVTTGGVVAQEATSKGYSLQLEEVLVTAQKREEDTMSVPITVNSFSAQDMVNTGADNIQDISDFMPGVEIGSGGATQVTITIRGIKSPNISSGGDPSVATFYDNAYMPRAATSIPFTDIARTEVLKGPQGTLFGRNATAGVINIVPNKPDEEFEGFVKSRIGDYGLLNVEGMINQPVTDEIAIRANVFSHQRDGIIDNVGIGDDLREEGFIAARTAILYDFSADTSIQLTADYEKRRENPQYSIGVSKYAYSTDPYNSKAANDVYSREENRDMWGASLQLDHSFNEEMSLFGIVSYRNWDTTNLQDEDGTEDPTRYLDSNNIEDSDIWYSEVRFNFANDKFNVVTGLNYSVEDVYQRTDIGLLTDSYMQFVSVEFTGDQDASLWDLYPDQPDAFWLGLSQAAGGLVNPPMDGIAVLPPSYAGQYFTETMDNTGDFTNWGIFGDVTYNLTETVRVSAGLRYSYDEKTYSWQTFPNPIDWPYAPARVNYNPGQAGIPEANYFDKFEDSNDWSKTTGRLVFDWQFIDSAMTYLSYATGYKSGGYDGQQFSSYLDGPYDPEEMTSIEWGFKGDFFDDRLRVEGSLFYQQLDGQQFSTDTKSCAPGSTQDECNDQDSTAVPTIISRDVDTEGAEIMVQWRALDSLLLTGMTTVRDAEITPQNYFNSDGKPVGGTKESESTNTDYTLRLDWTPEIPLGFLLVHVDYVFEEATDPGDTNDPIYTTGPWYFQDRELLNARIAWSNDAENFEVAVWGKNLQDNEIADNPGGFAASNLGVYKTSIEDPLTYGVDLRYSF